MTQRQLRCFKTSPASPCLLLLVALVVMFKRGGLVQVHLAMVTAVMTMVSLVLLVERFKTMVSLVERFKRGGATYYCRCISPNVPRSNLTTASAAQCRWRGPMIITINGGSGREGGGNPSLI